MSLEAQLFDDDFIKTNTEDLKKEKFYWEKVYQNNIHLNLIPVWKCFKWRIRIWTDKNHKQKIYFESERKTRQKKGFLKTEFYIPVSIC